MIAGARKLVAALAGFSLALGPGILDWPINPHVSAAYAKGGKGNGGGGSHGGSHGHSGGSHGNSGGGGHSGGSGNSGGGGHSGGGHGGSGGGNGNSGGSHGHSGGNGNSGGSNGNSGSGNNGNSNSGNNGNHGAAASGSKGSSANASPGQAKKAAQQDNRGQAKKAAKAAKDNPAAARKAVRRQRPAPSLAQTKAARAVPAPVASPFAVAESASHIRQARHEIVVQGLTPNDLANLRGLGFLTLRNFKTEKVARLHLPRGATLTEAKAAIAKINPEATADANHFYYPAGESCAGSGCVDLALVKWPVVEQAAEGCGSVPLIGMVDTAVDLSSPALQGQDIEILDGAE